VLLPPPFQLPSRILQQVQSFESLDDMADWNSQLNGNMPSHNNFPTYNNGYYSVTGQYQDPFQASSPQNSLPPPQVGNPGQQQWPIPSLPIPPRRSSPDAFRSDVIEGLPMPQQQPTPQPNYSAPPMNPQPGNLQFPPNQSDGQPQQDQFFGQYQPIPGQVQTAGLNRTSYPGLDVTSYPVLTGTPYAGVPSPPPMPGTNVVQDNGYPYASQYNGYAAGYDSNPMDQSYQPQWSPGQPWNPQVGQQWPN